MGLWQRLREARDANRQDRVRWAPTGPDDLSGAQVLFQSYGDGSDREPILPTMVGLANNAYAGSSVVFSLIAVRMLLFAEAVPRWWDKDKRRFEAATDGLDLLMYPWPGADHAEMQARAELDVSLAGNAFIAHPKDLDRLVRLRPDWVTIQRVQRVDPRGRPYTEVDGYWYGQPGVDDDWVFYDVDEVAHYAPYPDPLADFRGMSWLTPVVREVSHDHAMTEYATKFFDHAATPNMIVKYSQNLGPEKLRQAREAIHARHGGMENAYKAMILDSGADVTIAGNSFEQMGFNALRAATENRIASASGVPPMIPGFKEGLQAATLANYDAASRRLADMTMRPLWRSFASELRKIVQPPRKVGWEREKLELRFDASEVAALQEGKQAAADTFKTKALTAGELIRSGYDPKSVGDAVDAQDMSLLVHTEKTPTALYDEDGNQVNKKQGEDDGGDGEEPKKAGQPGGPKVQQGQGAAAPQPARSVIEDEEDELRPDDVQRLMESQRDAMLEAFRSGLEAGRLAVREVGDDSLRHPGHPDQKVHGRKGAGSGASGSGDSKDDPIRTSDPAVAAKALYEDKYVEFTSQRAVSTSLNKLKQMIDEAQARGEDKGKLNLCKATMAGTNLFCAENKGIPRVQMPQLSGKPKPGSKADKLEKNSKGEVNLGPAFREHLAAKGIKITDDEVDSSVLKATQNELETRKVLGIAQAMRDGKIPEARIFVTNDDYVVDGHHRWAAKVTNEFVQGQDLMQQVAVIDTDIITVLAEANSFALDMGIPPASIGVKGRSVVQPTSDLDLDAVLVESALGRALIEWMHGA